ncbi:DUF3221 domain-containing protein [Pontibacillus salipaludis]|uniref:DUF3221 domain-containing protein n=1 Tax=Pontibacillus salipaludis TaxID=1697394 RepID=A0ABQ1PZL8_9BACI|nr:DUF3221 domain-containing protein [Pontibacillus salipaludis]GGD08133.1 hypothetical protein GCM10011389_14580 [Pontibacillus salipaludis]
MNSLNQLKIFGFYLTISIFLIGCSNSEDSIKIEGYVVEVEKNRILVVENITTDEYEQLQDKSSDELMEQEEDLIYLETKSSNFNIGDKVQAMVSGVDASYPAQAYPDKIKKE